MIRDKIDAAPYTVMLYVLRRMVTDHSLVLAWDNGLSPRVFETFLDAATAQSIPEETLRGLRDSLYNAVGVPADPHQDLTWPRATNAEALTLLERILVNRSDREPDEARLAMNLAISERLAQTPEVLALNTEAPYTAMLLLVQTLEGAGMPFEPVALSAAVAAAMRLGVPAEVATALTQYMDDACGLPPSLEGPWLRCGDAAAYGNAIDFLTSKAANEPAALREQVRESQAAFRRLDERLP